MLPDLCASLAAVAREDVVHAVSHSANVECSKMADPARKAAVGVGVVGSQAYIHAIKHGNF